MTNTSFRASSKPSAPSTIRKWHRTHPVRTYSVCTNDFLCLQPAEASFRTCLAKLPDRRPRILSSQNNLSNSVGAKGPETQGFRFQPPKRDPVDCRPVGRPVVGGVSLTRPGLYATPRSVSKGFLELFVKFFRTPRISAVRGSEETRKHFSRPAPSSNFFALIPIAWPKPEGAL